MRGSDSHSRKPLERVFSQRCPESTNKAATGAVAKKNKNDCGRQNSVVVNSMAKHKIPSLSCELLQKISSYLQKSQDRFNFCVAHGRFASSVLWSLRKIHFNFSGDTPFELAYCYPDVVPLFPNEKIVRSCPQVREIKVTLNETGRVPEFDSFLQFRNLTTLIIVSFSNLDNFNALVSLESLKEIRLEDGFDYTSLNPLTSVTQISTLKISRCFLAGNGIDLCSFSHLTSLHLFAVEGLDLFGFPYTLSTLSPLKFLKMKHSEFGSYSGLYMLRNLQELDIKYSNFFHHTQFRDPDSERSPVTLSLISSLQTLTLFECNNSDLDSLSELSEFTSLFSLALEFDKPTTPFYGRQIVPNELKLNSLSSLTQLRQLALNIKARENNSFGSDLSSLSTLVLLNDLSLTHMGAMTDANALVTLTALKVLVLKHCSALEDISALKRLTNLQILDLSGCTNLTFFFPLQNSSSLKVLYLDQVRIIPNIACLEKIPSLKQICLKDCGMVQSHVVLPVIKKFFSNYDHSDSDPRNNNNNNNNNNSGSGSGISSRANSSVQTLSNNRRGGWISTNRETSRNLSASPRLTSSMLAHMLLETKSTLTSKSGKEEVRRKSRP